MIFGIPATSFWLMMLCAFSAGLLGTAAGTAILSLIRKKKNRAAQCALTKHHVVRSQPDCGWQRSAKDEQLYNGR